MRYEKPDYEQDVEEMFANIEAITTYESEPASGEGTDYRVFVSEGYTTGEATEAVEMEPVPGGHPISVSTATDDWFWVSVRPNNSA